MLRPRGNLNFSRKPSIDPIIGNELSKLARSISNITYGDTFPGRGATFGDMHFYTGEDTGDYKNKNWYVKTLDDDAAWQGMNSTSIIAENIQTGTIQSGVKIKDYLSLYGGEMSGNIIFYKNQKFDPSMLGDGYIPVGTKITGYVPQSGGVYTGNVDFSDKNLSSIGKLYGYDNLLYIDMSVDGQIVVGADDKISFISPLLHYGSIEITSAGLITGASGLISMWTNDVGYLVDSDLDAIEADIAALQASIAMFTNLDGGDSDPRINGDAAIIFSGDQSNE